MEGEGVVVEIRGIVVRLRPEQVQVMQLVARGMTYREIGAALGLTRYGVKERVLAVCNVTGAANRVEALCLLLQKGVIV